MQLSHIHKKSSMLVALIASVLSCGSASAAEKGFYGAVNASFGKQDKESFDYASGSNINTKFKDSYGGSLAAGYNYGSISPVGNVRSELEIGYRTSDVKSHSLNGGAPLAGSKGETQTQYGILNVYQDVTIPNSKIVPYLGVGLGYANVKYKNFGVAAIPNVLDDSINSIAYQGIVGAAYEITPTLALSLDYRYFATEDKDVTTAVGNKTSVGYDSNNVTVGLRYKF